MKKRRFPLPYLVLTVDLGWLLTVHTKLWYERIETGAIEYVRLHIGLCGKSLTFCLYSPDHHRR